MKTYIDMKACPFQAGDTVECLHGKFLATVVRIEDEHVWCECDGQLFYRTWTHDPGWNSGGGLVKKKPPTIEA